VCPSRGSCDFFSLSFSLDNQPSSSLSSSCTPGDRQVLEGLFRKQFPVGYIPFWISLLMVIERNIFQALLPTGFCIHCYNSISEVTEFYLERIHRLFIRNATIAFSDAHSGVIMRRGDEGPGERFRKREKNERPIPAFVQVMRSGLRFFAKKGIPQQRSLPLPAIAGEEFPVLSGEFQGPWSAGWPVLWSLSPSVTS
jgi:hypothetical protein